MKTKLLWTIILIFALGLSANLSARAMQSPANAAWSIPAIIYQDAWPAPLYSDLSDDGTRLVALIPYSGSDKTTRHIVVNELSGGTWQAPVIIAQNGAYSDESFQVLPQATHPVISGDGNTIAYVGYTGTTYGVYVVNRQGSAWSAPALVNTGLENTHYWISISQDGNTLAFCNYPFFGIQQVYVATRQAGIWSAPTLIGIGGDPSLSADGMKLVYVFNAQAAFSEKTGAVWSAPLQLTSIDMYNYNVEYPQLSGDGLSVHYWVVKLVAQGTVQVRTEQNLYVQRRIGAGWSEPQRINAAPVQPSSVAEGPAAADRYATRFIFTIPVTETQHDESVVYSSHLQTSEWVNNTWQEARLVEANGYGNYNKWPLLMPNGKTLIFDGGVRYTGGGGAVYDALWKMTTNDAPPIPPSVSGLIPPSGGSLYSEIDHTRYDFATGTFTDTVLFTHMYTPLPQPPPPGMTDIGHSFSITAVYSSTGLPAQPTIPFTVTIDYASSGKGGAISGSLRLWLREMSGWSLLGGMDHPASSTLVAAISHLSDFAALGEARQLFLPFLARP